MSIRKGVNRNLGERQKPVTDKYRDNYDRIFNKPKEKCCGDYANGLCPGCPMEENVEADSAADDLARRNSDHDIDNGANCIYCVHSRVRPITVESNNSEGYTCSIDDSRVWGFYVCDKFKGSESYERHYGGNNVP
jgi:hypothetical protein